MLEKPTPPEPYLLRAKDVAKQLQITLLTLYRLVKKGAGPPVQRLGRKGMLRFHHGAFLHWLETNSRKGS